MSDLLRVLVTRTFNEHSAGDPLLLADTAEVRKLITGGYFELIAIESTVPPKPTAKKKTTKSTKVTKSTKAKESADV